MDSIEDQTAGISLPEGYFCNHEGYLCLDLSAGIFETLPEEISIDEKTFDKKNEFHVTVINVRSTAKQIVETNTESMEMVEKKIKIYLSEYLTKNTIKFETFKDDVRLAVTADRASIAIRCQLSGLDGFFNLLEEKFGIKFPVQPTHVSLYTVTGAAVGIDTEEQMESFEKIKLPEIRECLGY